MVMWRPAAGCLTPMATRTLLPSTAPKGRSDAQAKGCHRAQKEQEKPHMSPAGAEKSHENALINLIIFFLLLLVI